MSEHEIAWNVTITPVPLELVPISRWHRLWLRILRRPMPTQAPEGTRAITLTSAEGRVIYIPAARIEVS